MVLTRSAQKKEREEQHLARAQVEKVLTESIGLSSPSQPARNNTQGYLESKISEETTHNSDIENKDTKVESKKSEKGDSVIDNIMNPLYEAKSMFHNEDMDGDSDNDSDYIDFENESVMDEESIPFISIRIDDFESLIHIRVRPNCLTKESLGRSILQVIKATTSAMDNSSKIKKIMKYSCFNENAPIEVSG